MAQKRDAPTVHLTAEMVRTLAHPLRSRLLGLLRVEGPATATQLATRIGTNSGATSYHLRQLAQAGLVEEDPDRGTRRERWWRSVHRSHSWIDTEHNDDPETRTAADWLIRRAHRLHSHWVEDWLDARTEWPNEWRTAFDQSDFQVTVTPEQLSQLNDRVHDLIEEYRHASDVDSPGTEAVTVIYYSFPLASVNL